ncbi:MAG: hypothetical protein HY741_28215 [Chloroflexi bacterium]|nr:hypothetical protein [Chloroflexota bacterium]
MSTRRKPPTRKSKRDNSLKELVGAQVYAVWLDMLKRLVPDGRTHRLAPLAAGMLQYAAYIANEKQDELEDNAAAQILRSADEDGYSDETLNALAGLVEQLFDDAGVGYARRSSRGEDYSIAEEAANEYIAWYDMPWE